MQSGVAYEFRTTCVPGLVELDDVLTIAAVLGPDEQYFLQQFRSGAGVLDPAWANVPAYAPSMLRSFVQVASGIVRRVALRGC